MEAMRLNDVWMIVEQQPSRRFATKPLCKNFVFGLKVRKLLDRKPLAHVLVMDDVNVTHSTRVAFLDAVVAINQIAHGKRHEDPAKCILNQRIFQQDNPSCKLMQNDPGSVGSTRSPIGQRGRKPWNVSRVE